MPDKVLFLPQAPPPQHDAAEWHSRVTFQIGPQRYLFEFTGSVTRIPPTSATLISIDRRETNRLRPRAVDGRIALERSRGDRADECIRRGIAARLVPKTLRTHL